MTSAPLSQPLALPSESLHGFEERGNPVSAFKQLVIRLQREQHKTQDLLSGLGFALRSFNNLNQFLDLIPLMGSRVVDADGGVLILFRPDGQFQLEGFYCHGLPTCQSIRRTLETATQEVTTLGTPSLPEAMAVLEHQVHHCLEPEVQIFSVPVLVKSQERGQLYLFSRSPDYIWTGTRQRLIRLVTDQTAVAIENNDLSQALRQKDRLDRELEIGSEIQEQLLPRCCPAINGVDIVSRWQPAGHVGGDYFDFIPENIEQIPLHPDQREDGSWSIVIGDVMGKGVPAALLMSLLRGTLRAEVLNRHSPAQILQHLNQLMYPDLENSHRFVSLFYSLYDPKTRTLAYANAAHNPPLLWSARTQTVQRLDVAGMLVGLDARSHYQEAQIHLLPGDTVLYYTDGLTEAANRKGDRFDEEHLIHDFQEACCRFGTAQLILDDLSKHVQQFVGVNKSNVDDMTLIVMRVQSGINV